MKKILTLVAGLLLAIPSALNASEPDDILGKYVSELHGTSYKVEVFRNADGSYKGRLFWVKDSVDPDTGEKYLDTKNPVKSLRTVPCDRIVIFDGLRYNAGKDQWDGTKIYDPKRGIRANVVIRASEAGGLSVKGSLLGISETVKWKRL
jgi:uncharacterized protein (DUF2147 family)